ncbi:hypothetical protein DSO57_1017024 [Entomophthora muscae]|uniref:Uncharacterized protein n=1 Tax=Entomophthora muscae TaxID=34485 RepID=A0ACC2TSD5_9FUNG|nr:hypothetical protein DSO57_1017024 [Entomophthora muscae]
MALSPPSQSSLVIFLNIHRQVGNLVLPLVFYFLPNKKQNTYLCALTILKTKLDEIFSTLEEEHKETRVQKKKTLFCQGSSLWGVLGNLRADSLRDQQEGPTTRLEGPRSACRYH